eukprot:CAMPEP_0206412014 /NCGR_PEP_ID=MMETSP0294-20121207/33698_1 /ASSEMBLY_ACC=CAM_ASM_000327 /TAXON_ID=39354 /ORGANISM="Heterosigma akashiwo, Strain CCMP2393" /LENGTH=217 /DNA_ID=CAMNT_0053872995 /DNA_START=334 /DNA_END=982 /DNA_ORIENTATION=+
MAILYSKSKVFSHDELWRLLLQRDGHPCETNDSFEQLLGFLNKLLDTDIQELSKQPIHLEPEPMSRSSDSSFCPSKMNTSVSFRFVLERTYPPESDAVWCSLKVKQYIKTQEDNVGFLFGSCGKRFWLKFNDNLGEIMGSPFVVEIIYQIASDVDIPSSLRSSIILLGCWPFPILSSSRIWGIGTDEPLPAPLGWHFPGQGWSLLGGGMIQNKSKLA